MPNNKDNPQSGSQASTPNTRDREFESQGKNKGFEGGGQGQQAGSSGRGTGSPGATDDDEMTTAGGKQGQFSDKNRGSEGQWSPGSSQESE